MLRICKLIYNFTNRHPSTWW